MQRRAFLTLAGGLATAAGLTGGRFLLAPRLARAGGASQQARIHVLLSQPTPPAEQSLTLRQAWQLALQQGQVWSADAAVALLSSRDQAAAGVSTERADAESTGKRAVWEAILVALSKPSAQLQVIVDNGKVTQSKIQPRSMTEPPIVAAPALDSTDAIKAARAARPPLGPAEGKSHGYGYSLQRGGDGRATLAVIGSIHSLPARLDFDAATGKRIGASAYMFSEGGVISSLDAGQTWRASNLSGCQIQQVVTVPGQPGVAYAVALAGLGTAVSRTTDAGRTWQDVGSLPADGDPRPTSLAAVPHGSGMVLAAGATTGLWLSRDNGVSWTRPAGLPAGAVSSLGVAGARLLASVAGNDPSSGGVYASGDLRQWQRLLPGTCHLSTIAGGRTVVALSNSGGTTAHVITGAAVRPLALTIPALRAAGTDLAGRSFLVGDGTDVALSRDGGQSWTTALHTNSASIAVAPAASGAGVALVSGFRTGIFRSPDGGSTWRHVLSSVSSILAGSDEVGSLAFLSSSDVVAAQGAVQTWQQV